MKLCMETLPQEAPFILWKGCLNKGNEIFLLTNCRDEFQLSPFKHNPSFSMRQMNFRLYVKNVSSHFTHSYILNIHYKTASVQYLMLTHDETMMRNYKRVSYSACILYEWIIQKVEEHKLSLWNEHTWFAAAALFAGVHQWHVKALWNTNVI